MAAAPRPLGATLSASAYPLAVASAVFIIAVGLPSTDSDTYWQLAMGRWMLDHHAFLRQDIFSSTVAGAHFGVGEWLGQISFAGSFAAAGWAGVAVLRATLLAAAAFFVVRLARRGGTPWWISLPLVVAAFVLLVIGSALLRGGSLLEAMLLAPLLYLAFTAQRQMLFFCFAATAFLGARLSVLVRSPRAFELPVPVRLPVATVLVIAALASALAAPTRPDEHAYPAAALDTLRQDSGILLNEYDWGGYLIFNLPERPVFIDGRYVPYLGGVLADYRALVGLRPGWRDLLDKYKVSELLLRPDRPLAVALREDGWRVRSSDADGRWIVLSRP